MTHSQFDELLSTPFITQACLINRPMIDACYFSCNTLTCKECSLRGNQLCEVHDDDFSPSQLDYLKLNHPELFV